MTKEHRLIAMIARRQANPALALLVHLAERVRQAKQEKRELQRRAKNFEISLEDFEGLFNQAVAAENALWNALQGCKESYETYIQKETT